MIKLMEQKHAFEIEQASASSQAKRQELAGKLLIEKEKTQELQSTGR